MKAQESDGQQKQLFELNIWAAPRNRRSPECFSRQMTLQIITKYLHINIHSIPTSERRARIGEIWNGRESDWRRNDGIMNSGLTRKERISQEWRAQPSEYVRKTWTNTDEKRNETKRNETKLMALSWLIVFYLQTFNLKTSKDEVRYMFSQSELNIRARKKISSRSSTLTSNNWTSKITFASWWDARELLTEVVDEFLQYWMKMIIASISIEYFNDPDSKTFLTVLVIWQPFAGYVICCSINSSTI
jgi:hypothetical protein